MKLDLKCVEQNDIIKPIAITIITAILSYFFYLLAYIFFYAYYFHGSKLPIFRMLINPIPLETKSLIFLGIILAIAIAFYGIFMYKVYQIEQAYKSLELLIYTCMIYILSFVFIVGLLYFSNNTTFTTISFDFALVPTAFTLMLYMIYRFKLLEFLASLLITSMSSYIIASIFGNLDPIELTSSSLFWGFFIISSLSCLMYLPRIAMRRFVEWSIFFLLTITFSNHIKIIPFSIWIELVLYLLIPTILTFTFENIIDFYQKHNSKLQKMKNTKITITIKDIFGKNNKVILIFFSLLIVVFFLPNFVYMLG